MATSLLAGEIAGMRCALQSLVDAAHITVDHLVFAAGVNYDATALVLRTIDDGRLTPLRSLLAALDARLEIHLPAGCRIVIARLAAPPERKPEVTQPLVTVPSTIPRRKNKPNIRSQLSQAELLKLYDAGLPMTHIAERAGISRQRVFAIAKAQGRTLRRVEAAQARRDEAASIFSQ
jgi:hypothetical protein